ncbi:arsenic transporter [Paractinoplanes abujensis]|uniref:Arsenical pump membrane protein n=1 Tax=Paractinoplanes abujensis TaxID=882441 RepID=A0A7W7CZ09_9ACTN|nr:SLC13 family permease [Actinoplanes abujensis]MBB4695616.1 arsenical pump membrane protein [Actinoplanes abujensis]GID23201.1 arsenic transporter [Actinoplanes abujensis]
MSLIIAASLLATVLVFAVVRPRGLPEAVAAVPAAALAIAFGLVSWDDAVAEFRELGPTVGFLAAVLVLAHLAGEHGVFRYAGRVAARISRGDPPRLLAAVFVTAALTTAFLSLDATVVLLTPVVLATAARVGARARPHAYASAHLANSASLLLPVSNLTNLLAFAASGLTFLGFTGLMTLPWLAVIVVEFLVFRRFFRADLVAREEPRPDGGNGPPPRYALIVLAVTLIGFAVVHPLGVHPAWVAVAGAVLLAVPRRVGPRTLIREANLPFCAFVLALGVVVLAVQRHGLERFLGAVVPDHADLLGLLAVAALAALLANLLNNLPATLALLPVVEAKPGLLLAMLIGVNVGPNLTYVGSLATLLWRQILHTHDAAPDPRDFLKLGVLTVPPALVAGVLALWLSLRIG